MIISEIVNEIIEETVSDLSDIKMLVYLKSGMRFVPSFIRSRFLLEEGTINLLLGASTVSLNGLSVSMTRERNVWYLDDQGERMPILNPPSSEYFHRNLISNAGLGKPAFYRIFGKTMQFDKKADSNVTIGLDYFKEISKGLLLNDNFIGDETLIEGIKCFAKGEYYSQYEEDLEKGREYERKGKEIISVIDEEYQDKEFGGYVEETEFY